MERPRKDDRQIETESGQAGISSACFDIIIITINNANIGFKIKRQWLLVMMLLSSI